MSVFQNFSTIKRPCAQKTRSHCESITIALDLYRGDFLQGDTEKWTLTVREYWQERYRDVLTSLASAHARLGQYDRALEFSQKALQNAACLFGTASVQYRHIQFRLPEAEHRDYQRYIDLTRQALGAAVFEKAWEMGCAMTLNQALSYARTLRVLES